MKKIILGLLALSTFGALIPALSAEAKTLEVNHNTSGYHLYVATSATQNMISAKVLPTQQIIAKAKCDGVNPPPICDGEPLQPPRKPTPAPTSNRDYTAAVKFLLNNSSSMQQVIETTWNQAGKGIAAQKIKEILNGRQVSNGVGIYDANVNIGSITSQQVTGGSNPNQINVQIVVRGNDTEFHTTTPTIFGSYADPSFRVGFDLTINLTMSVGQSTTPIKIDDLNVQITHANIHGSNAVGTLVETLGDLFTNGRFSQDITSRINQDISLKGRLAQAIQSAIDRVLPAKVATKIEQLSKIPTKFPVIFRKLP